MTADRGVRRVEWQLGRGGIGFAGFMSQRPIGGSHDGPGNSW
jgi:hypothetical protein